MPDVKIIRHLYPSTMYKFISWMIILFLCLNVKAQEIKVSSSLIGFGTAKLENGKKLVQTRFFDLGYEKMIDYFWRWRVGIGYSDIKYDGVTKTTVEYYRHKKFLTLPMAIRKYFSVSKKTEAYVEFGVFNRYEVTDKIDFNDPAEKDVSYTNNGYALDLHGFGGFKTQLGKRSTIDIGIGGMKNLLTRYKISQNKIRVLASYITLTLSKKISR